MEKSLKGSVVIIQFPFSDLTGSKKRPALVIADWDSSDVILAQITSVAHKDTFAINLTDKDFSVGSLQKQLLSDLINYLPLTKQVFLTQLEHFPNKRCRK